jgi:hypothetical protein
LCDAVFLAFQLFLDRETDHYFRAPIHFGHHSVGCPPSER